MILNNAYFSTVEVAKIIGISRVAVLKRIKTGKIPAEKIGRNYAISKETLQATLGNTVSAKQKIAIEKIVKKAVKEYNVTFRRLGREE